MTARVEPLPAPREPEPGEAAMPFGKHTGWPVVTVPLTYRLWVVAREWIRRDHPAAWRAARASVIRELLEQQAAESAP